MNNELMNWTYKDHPVRVVILNGEPWWVLKDVCDALEMTNARVVADRLDEDEVRVSKVYTGNTTRVANVISEAGLYSVIMRSNKPEAKAFSRWVTHEVLPEIRKTGGYGQPKPLTADDITPAMLRGMADRMEALENRVDEQQTELGEQKTLLLAQGQQIAEMRPKAAYYDLILQSKDPVKISVIAKDYGMSAIAMNKLLNKLGIQYKQGDIWLLYQAHADVGYTQTKTHSFRHKDGSEGSRVHTYWTQKGRLFLYDTLKEYGVLPLIEREEQESVG